MAEPLFYMADTHSLLWHLYDIPRLGPGAQAAFQRVSNGRATLFIPAIVLAEIVHTVERRRHDIDLREALDAIAEANNFQVLPFDLEGARALIDRSKMHLSVYLIRGTLHYEIDCVDNWRYP